jgi:hypothetical protein
VTPDLHAESSGFSADDEAMFVRMQDELRAYNDAVVQGGRVPPAWTRDDGVFLRFRAWQALKLREKTRQVVERFGTQR